MIPCSWAASSASAICFAMGKASSSRNRPLCDPIRERRPLDEFEHQRRDAVRIFEAVDAADVRMVQRRQDLGLTLEARHAIGIVAEGRGQNLQRNVSTELRVLGAIDLPHAAGAEGGDNLVRVRGVCQKRGPRVA